ncbi:uncharacterized protein LOC100371069 [Saccoglossus kowalevskii]|uniref:Uncharacterized protein LOC100371069 n=1 Tax=Saccoglossus kowalevskii TaxID=10224 RepID=A0ABM0GVD0_SACKO|nr:PREDICTED: uncharacterized protein LOC100371069 [Saccoglossus kowalevskii]
MYFKVVILVCACILNVYAEFINIEKEDIYEVIVGYQLQGGCDQLEIRCAMCEVDYGCIDFLDCLQNTCLYCDHEFFSHMCPMYDTLTRILKEGALNFGGSVTDSLQKTYMLIQAGFELCPDGSINLCDNECVQVEDACNHRYACISDEDSHAIFGVCGDIVDKRALPFNFSV